MSTPEKVKPANNGRLIVIFLGLVLLFILFIGLIIIMQRSNNVKTYKSDDPELTFQYPSDWYVEQDLEEFYIAETDFNETDVKHSMEIIANNAADFGSSDIDTIISQKCEEYSSALGYDSLPNDDTLALKGVKAFETKNMKGCEFTLSDSLDSENGYQFVYYVAKKPFIYNITISGLDSRETAKIDQFKNIIKSLESLE